MIAIAWLIFGGVLLGVLAFCYLVVKYYQDKREAERLPTIVAVIGLTLTLLCVFLIPVDIYNVSSSVNHSTGEVTVSPEAMATRSKVVQVLYYVLYSFILVFAFGLIPFSYFYYEEDDEQVTIKQKVWGGCKYTIFLILIVVIFLAIGLFLFFVKPGEKPTSTANAKEWVKKLTDQNVGEAAIGFAISCLTLIGYFCWMTYTAYGLSAFPIGMIRGKRHLAEEVSDVKTSLGSTREKTNAIKSKYLSGRKKMTKKDSEQLDLLKRKERILSRQNMRLESQVTGWRKIWTMVKPFMFIFGFIFMLFSLLIVASMFLTSIDKAINSSDFCGSKCGFVLAYPKVFNPLDTTLTELSKFFPLDYVLLSLIIFYIFFTTLAGITRIGVRFFWVYLYKVRRGTTPPQGLLVAVIILMLSILSLNMELTTIAPQYINFGSQVWKNETSGDIVPCSLDSPTGKCTMTQIGTFVNKISVKTVFFGYAFFFATWVFILCWLIGLVIAAFKSKPSNVEQRESDSDTDED